MNINNRELSVNEGIRERKLGHRCQRGTATYVSKKSNGDCRAKAVGFDGRTSLKSRLYAELWTMVNIALRWQKGERSPRTSVP